MRAFAGHAYSFSVRGGNLKLALPALALAAALNALHPVGYVGGGFDDYHYLSAARCVAEQGWCVPGDHWARRFPLVLPMALAIRVFGESREALWVVPAIAAALAIWLFVIVVARAFGARAAMLAGTVFAATPLIAGRVLVPGIDMVELALALGGVALLQRQRALAAGICFGLAVQCRPTMLALGPVLLLFLWRDPRTLVRLALGGAIPLAVEAGIYALMLGDPFATWRLSLDHTRIPSSELTGVDLDQSPLFNRDFIAGWAPAAGIQAHWSVKALVNFLAHRELMLTNLFFLVTVALGWRGIDKRLRLMLGGAVVFFAILVFGFAIDPKPRMFLPVVAVQCAVIGILAPAVPRAVLVLLLVGLGVGSIAAAYDWPDRREAARIVAARLRADPELQVELYSARSLALLGRDWPVWRGGSTRVVSFDNHLFGMQGWTLRTEQVFVPEPAAITWLRDHRLFAGPRRPTYIATWERKPDARDGGDRLTAANEITSAPPE